jgi:hypothetical protein
MGRRYRVLDAGSTPTSPGTERANGFTLGSMSTTRAVVRAVEPGNDVRCAGCGKQIKFAARTHPRQVIANIYIDGSWNRVEHFHEECYLEASEPYGQIDGLDGPTGI